MIWYDKGDFMDLTEIKHLAELSNLEFSQQELQDFEKEFASLVALADNIKNANIEGKRIFQSIELNELRPDTIKPSLSPTALLQNAPVQKKDCFVVPRVVE